MDEKRAHVRAPANIDVTFTKPDQTTGAGRTKDISVGGMFIETDEPEMTFGEEITIKCRLPSSDQELVLPAVVRWWRKPNGFGVQFGLLGAKETRALTEFMKGSM